MVALDYQEAHKMAIKEYRRAMTAGESPYPDCLDEKLSPAILAEGKRIGREQIPLALVVGTKTGGRNHAFARNFMPLLDMDSEFAAKWSSLCQSHLEEGIRQPVKVYEYRNRFYVEEGNKRVSVLKYFDADSIDAEVIQIPSHRSGQGGLQAGQGGSQAAQGASQAGPEDPAEDVAARNYEAFLQFYHSSHMRTVEFSEPESYLRLQKLVKKTGDAWEEWTEDEQREFRSMYYFFHREYVKAGGDGRLPQVCDVMLAFLEKFGYEEVCGMSPGQLCSALEEDPEGFRIQRSRADQTLRAVKKLPQATLSGGVRSGKQVVRSGKRVVGSGKRVVGSGKRVVRSSGRQVVDTGSRLIGGGLPAKLLSPFGAGLFHGRHDRWSGGEGRERRRFRILAVADDESRCYYEDYRQGNLDEFDLILACGDLHRTYLEFLTTMAKCPVLYIRGNHDDALMEEPPGGCICVEDQVYVHDGLRIAGLGGSHRYRDGRNMYTEAQMRKRARRLMPKIRKQGGLDILMTHAPARGVNDFDSVSHRGFETFRDLLDRYHPQVFVHGHIHKNYGVRIPQRTDLNGTTVINAYEHCIFEIEI